MKKLLALLMLVCSQAYADEVIVGFDENKDLPVLNEELRKLDERLITLEASPSYTPTTSNALSGSTLQVVNTNYSTYANLGSTAVPLDDSIPQITEGNAISGLDTSITAHSATNILFIEALVYISNNTNAVPVSLSLFQDSTSDALATSAWVGSQSSPMTGVLRWRMVAGTTSATTFKLRVGDGGGGTMHINGTADGGARIYGGALVSSLKITEIKA